MIWMSLVLREWRYTKAGNEYEYFIYSSRKLVIHIANYADRLDPSGKFFNISTKLTCLEIIEPSAVQCYGF
jgi:hypothetical protein